MECNLFSQTDSIRMLLRSISVNSVVSEDATITQIFGSLVIMGINFLIRVNARGEGAYPHPRAVLSCTYILARLSIIICHYHYYANYLVVRLQGSALTCM